MEQLGSLQESILALLIYREEGKQVLGLLASEDFEDPYRVVFNKTLKCIEQYRTIPGTHIYDELQEECKKDGTVKDALDIIYSIKNDVKTSYVLPRISRWKWEQQLKRTLLDVANDVQTGKEIGTIQAKLRGSLSWSSDSDASLGLDSSDAKSFFRALRQKERFDYIPQGIKEFDYRNVCPAKGQLYLIMALAKIGKSQWMVQIARSAAMQRCNVLIVTLEMSEDLYMERFAQSITGSRASYDRVGGRWDFVSFNRDDRGMFSGFKFDSETERPMVTYDSAVKHMGYMGGRVIIKSFPTGMLTMDGLESYLDMLETQSDFVPDLIALDYADLMKINPRYIREEIGEIHKQLRGRIATERKTAVVTATQSNRGGLKESDLDESNIAEDFSKTFTCDNLVAIMRTKAEAAMGLARLKHVVGRYLSVPWTVLISQNYSLGQFCTDSVFIKDDPKKLIDFFRDARARS